jgi:hypothetical protein
MNPTVTSTAGLPTVILTGGFLQMSFTRARGDVTYEVQQSTDLLTWVTVVINPGTVGTLVAVPVASGAPGRKFLRLKMTRGP